jgi:uncharacterized protein YkwD
MKILITILFFMSAIPVFADEEAPVPSRNQTSPLTPLAPPSPTALTVEMWKIHSKHRELNGLKPQESHPELNRAAQAWAEKMAKNGWFCHSTYSLNENIARGQDTPRLALRSWINSSGHNANLLSNYKHCGFGVAKSGDMHYWVSLHANLKEGQKIPESQGCSSSGRRFRFRWWRR